MEKMLWSQTCTIRTYDLDAEERASVQSLCRYLLDAAGNHADALGFSVPQLNARDLTWMLSRFRLRLERVPGWRETLTLETWPSGIERLFALRGFHLSDGKGAVLGAAGSAWLLINTASRRPVRPQTLFAGLSFPPRRILSPNLEKLPSPGRVDVELGFRVRYSDLDVNQHVTSASYVDWLLEAVPPDTRRACSLRELEISFLAESLYGESLFSRAQRFAADPPLFLHSLVREQDGQELLRARSSWQPD
jgi:medium-chain acyl-[acyl-carrier-protein] hydrolase